MSRSLADRTTAGAPGPSPPTDRVVEVVELLAAGGDRSWRVADIARALRLNRSTCTALLGSLEAAGWVERRPDRSFGLGSGLVGVATAVRARLPVLHHARPVLRRLAEAGGFGCSLSQVGGGQLTVLARVGSPDRFPPGTAVGSRFPTDPPFGLVAVAWWPEEARRAWLARRPLGTEAAGRLEAAMATVRARGVGTWALAEGSAALLEALGRLLGALAEHPAEGDLRAEIAHVLGAMGARPYTADELAGPGPRSVSFLVAPVFDADGAPRHEIECHLMRPSVSDRQLRRLERLVVDAAAELTGHLGGSWPIASG